MMILCLQAIKEKALIIEQLVFRLAIGEISRTYHITARRWEALLLVGHYYMYMTC